MRLDEPDDWLKELEGEDFSDETLEICGVPVQIIQIPGMQGWGMIDANERFIRGGYTTPAQNEVRP